MHLPMHPDRRFHSKYLLQLLDLEVTEALVDYLAETVVCAIPTARNRPQPHQEGKLVSEFKHFAQNFVKNAPGGMRAILVAFVYVERAKSRLLTTSTRQDWGRHDLFLGAIIVASKYIIDHHIRPIIWARAAVLPGKPAIFRGRDMNVMELEFLKLHDWELGFTEEDILSHFNDIARLYNLPKRPPKRPPPPLPDVPPPPQWPSPPLPPQRTVAVPPVCYVPPRHPGAPIRGSMTRRNLLAPQHSTQPIYTTTVVHPPHNPYPRRR